MFVPTQSPTSVNVNPTVFADPRVPQSQWQDIRMTGSGNAFCLTDQASFVTEIAVPSNITYFAAGDSYVNPLSGSCCYPFLLGTALFRQIEFLGSNNTDFLLQGYGSSRSIQLNWTQAQVSATPADCRIVMNITNRQAVDDAATADDKDAIKDYSDQVYLIVGIVLIIGGALMLIPGVGCVVGCFVMPCVMIIVGVLCLVLFQSLTRNAIDDA